MEGVELQLVRKCLHSFPKLPLWIIEYIWTHTTTDIQEVMDPSTWPEMDFQPLSLEDSLRLRVTSAQVYSIMKHRDMEHFERVMSFLEATYVLLPRLVAPIKHMKIMFGLKTMAIMWMLREGRGMVDTVFKINKFFPSKLPQYQDQCSPHEMFLMRKNHLDFKALALTLAMDKDKLEDYIMKHARKFLYDCLENAGVEFGKNSFPETSGTQVACYIIAVFQKQMEQQYGEHYAQKVEDRLLHYLHELTTVLPGDTYIDKILKKGSPVAEEEKLLLEVISSDSMTIATTLKKLLHSDVSSCCSGKVYQSSEHGKNGMESSQLSKSSLHGSSSKAFLKSVEAKAPLGFQPGVFRRGEGADQDVSKDSPLLFENDTDSDVRGHQQTEEGIAVVERVEEESRDKERGEISQRSSECVQEATSSPQFCSKHQRWVKSILQECPDECSEELLLQANVSSSPPLFQSSSSITSSQDLTPSDLIPCLPDQQHPPTQTSTHLQTAAQACEQANPEDKLTTGSPGSASYTSQSEPLSQPPSSKDTLLPSVLLPVVQLIDIASVRGINLASKRNQASSSHFTMSSTKQATLAPSPQELSSPHCHTSGNDAMPQGMMKDLTFDQPNTMVPTNSPSITHQTQIAPVSQDASISVSSQPQTWQYFPKFRWAFTPTRHSQTLDRFRQNPVPEQLKMVPTTFQTSCLSLSFDSNISRPSTHDASTSMSRSGMLSSVYNANQVVPQRFIKPLPQTHISPFQSKTLTCSTVVSSASNSSCMAVRSKTSRVRRAQLMLSLSSQAMLLQSKLLQPYVSLTRLSAQECYQMTMGRSSTRYVEPVARCSNNVNEKDRRKEEEEDADSSFDPNILYSSNSSNSDSKDSLDCDPDYKPCIRKKRLLLEYETAKSLSHILQHSNI